MSTTGRICTHVRPLSKFVFARSREMSPKKRSTLMPSLATTNPSISRSNMVLNDSCNRVWSSVCSSSPSWNEPEWSSANF